MRLVLPSSMCMLKIKHSCYNIIHITLPCITIPAILCIHTCYTMYPYMVYYVSIPAILHIHVPALLYILCIHTFYTMLYYVAILCYTMYPYLLYYTSSYLLLLFQRCRWGCLSQLCLQRHHRQWSKVTQQLVGQLWKERESNATLPTYMFCFRWTTQKQQSIHQSFMNSYSK